MLAELLSYRPRLMVAAVGTWIVGFCVPLLSGLVTQAIFNDLQAKARPSLLLTLFALLIALAVVGPVILTVWIWAHVTFESTIESLVRTNMFEWILSGQRRGQSPAKLIGHVRDDVPSHTDVVNEWYRLSGEALFVLIALIIMIKIDAKVAVLTFLPLAAVVLFTHWMRNRLPLLWADSRDATVRVTDLIADVFSNVLAIKTAGAQHAIAARLREADEARMRTEVHLQVVRTRIEAMTDSIVVIGQGLVLLIAARAMLSHQFSVGDFVLFTIYLEWMLLLPRRMGRLLSQRQESRRALQRLGETMTDSPLSALVRHRPIYLSGELPEVPVPRRPDQLRELRVTGLSFHYPGTDRGIADVSFGLTRGTVTVLTGEVGSGKSTLVETLLGLHKSESGKVYWNGAEVDDLVAFMISPRVAYKPQLPRLFSTSLRENILLGLPDDDEQLSSALKLAAFDASAEGLASGWDTLLGPRGARLSGGQTQRASVARMFVRQAEFCVIDDLSSALDQQTEFTLWARLDAAKAAGDTTYLVVSHRAEALRRADQILVLEEGRIRNCGPLASLIAVSPVVRQIMDATRTA